MKFKYTALGTKNQKLEGVLDAESIEGAREKLHKMGLSIIACNEISKEEIQTLEKEEAAEASREPEGNLPEKEKQEAMEAKQIVTYLFVAIDAQKKEVNGAIDAKDPYSAYKRLITEYHFSILDLYEENSPNPSEASYKAQFNNWNGMLAEEGVDINAKASTGVKSELQEEGEAMDSEIVKEIDHFIINSKTILEKHKDQYTDSLFREIQKTLDTLQRIRTSNNLKHITKTCNNLYELISHPDINLVKDPNKESENKEYTEIVSSMKESGFVQNQFEFLQGNNLKKKSANFQKVQGIFTKIMKKLNKNSAKKLNSVFPTETKEEASKKGEMNLGGLAKLATKVVIAPNSILRRARKQDLSAGYNEWKANKEKLKVEKAEKKANKPTEAKSEKRDFTNLFMELDSFIGWLLFLYIGYLFLATFSLEKGVGIPKELVIKTLGNPLIINITILLIILHFAFTLKLRFLRRQFLSTIFLFFFSIGIYTILIVNF